MSNNSLYYIYPPEAPDLRVGIAQLEGLENFESQLETHWQAQHYYNLQV